MASLSVSRVLELLDEDIGANEVIAEGSDDELDFEER